MHEVSRDKEESNATHSLIGATLGDRQPVQGLPRCDNNGNVQGKERPLHKANLTDFQTFGTTSGNITGSVGQYFTLVHWAGLGSYTIDSYPSDLGGLRLSVEWNILQ